MAASCQLGLLLLRRDVRISSSAAARARVQFISVGLLEGCIPSEVFHQTVIIQLKESLRNFRRGDTSRSPFFGFANDRKKIKC